MSERDLRRIEVLSDVRTSKQRYVGDRLTLSIIKATQETQLAIKAQTNSEKGGYRKERRTVCSAPQAKKTGVERWKIVKQGRFRRLLIEEDTSQMLSVPSKTVMLSTYPPTHSSRWLFVLDSGLIGASARENSSKNDQQGRCGSVSVSSPAELQLRWSAPSLARCLR